MSVAIVIVIFIIITIIIIRSVQLQFKQEFFGIVYADYDRNSACKVAEHSICCQLSTGHDTAIDIILNLAITLEIHE